MEKDVSRQNEMIWSERHFTMNFKYFYWLTGIYVLSCIIIHQPRNNINEDAS